MSAGPASDTAVAYEEISLRAPWASDAAAPIVLQHGLGLSREVWLPWAGQLAARGRVVLPDLRGHGSSAASWARETYSAEDFLQDIVGVLDRARVDRCHFVGESFGGTLGLMLAARHSERVCSVTVCSTAYRGVTIRNIAHWPELVDEEDGIGRWSREISAGRFGEAASQSLLGWVDALQRRLEPRVVAGIVRCLQGLDLTEEIRTLALPALVIAPAGSPFVGVENARSLAAEIPFAELVYLRRAMHGAVLTHWRECVAATSAFVDRVDRGLECSTSGR